MKHRMCILIFSTILFEIFLTLRRIRRDIMMNVKSLHVKYPLFLQNFNKIRMLATYFRKILNIKFHQNPSSGSRVVPG
jgi:hypothetical protein